MKAIYQIPLCVSFVLLAVQVLRASLAALLRYVVNHCEESPEQRW